VVIYRCMQCVAATLLLTGCAAGTDGSYDRDIAKYGYRYHDGNHTGGSSQASPEAVYNATHGTWLWPPMDADIPSD